MALPRCHRPAQGLVSRHLLTSVLWRRSWYEEDGNRFFQGLRSSSPPNSQGAGGPGTPAGGDGAGRSWDLELSFTLQDHSLPKQASLADYFGLLPIFFFNNL